MTSACVRTSPIDRALPRKSTAEYSPRSRILRRNMLDRVQLYTCLGGTPPSRRLMRRRPAAAESETLSDQPAWTPAFLLRKRSRRHLLRHREVVQPDERASALHLPPRGD